MWARGVVAERDVIRETLQEALDDLCRLGATGAQGQVYAGGRDVTATAGVGMPAAGRFRIGCTTGAFTAAVVLLLADEGRLHLDDPVERHAPGLLPDARITVRHLLQHTSGLADYVGDLAAGSRLARHEPRDLVALALAHGPRSAPGTHWAYANTNAVLAGLLVRAVTGRPWAEQVRNRIVRPLGLRDTYFPYDHTGLPRSSARAYQQLELGGPLFDVTELNPTALDAAGGLVSSTADLTRFWRALRTGELLSPAARAEFDRTVAAETYQDVRAGIGYGLGAFRVPGAGGGFWSHPGDVPGTATCNGVSADGSRSVVLYRTTTPADQALRGCMDERALRLVEEVLAA
ncbi:serine hydrolase domain-containing protein [Dactylosporangium matsuzakiense]|uniref:Serine hydrolase n=1 Tax=Dactylosporangium matsuzakiense TaxID=53360 RepID=A0A9W6KUQ1_9ACTN|nr:serine hydrolase domain-containing protein [Dactylosporangium matsuzakiense]UWZ49088.1 beta-lactamase family protein [Dactylosporangium matsuzakiense]GLL08018.1 serine hydrolase [Dactylosporangium matsuzakiense]